MTCDTLRAARAYVAQATLPGQSHGRPRSTLLRDLNAQNRLAERWYRFGTLRYGLRRYGRPWQTPNEEPF